MVKLSIPAMPCLLLSCPALVFSVCSCLIPLSSCFDFVLLCCPQFCSALGFPAVVCSRRLSSLYIFHIYIRYPAISFLLISSYQLPSPHHLISEEQNLKKNVQIKSTHVGLKIVEIVPLFTASAAFLNNPMLSVCFNFNLIQKRTKNTYRSINYPVTL